MTQNLHLHEIYRPQTWEEVVGQPAAMKKLEVLRKRGFGGRAFFWTGPSGDGKTSIVRLIAIESGELCDEPIESTLFTSPEVR